MGLDEFHVGCILLCWPVRNHEYVCMLNGSLGQAPQHVLLSSYIG